MSYTPDPTDITQPTDATSAETAQAEFRALKVYLQGLANRIQIWNPTDSGPDITYTAANLIANLNAVPALGNEGARAIYPVNSGKTYWEVVYTAGSAVPRFGIASINWNVNSALGIDNFSYGWGTGGYLRNNVLTGLGVAPIAGDIIGFALDLTALTLQIFKNNVSQGTIAGIPAGSYFPAFSASTADAVIQGNFNAQSLMYAPPAGYSAFYNSSSTTSTSTGTRSVRQTVINGSVDANGLPNFLSASATPLIIKLAATAVPVGFTVANGFASGYPVDLTGNITADIASAWNPVDNATSYLYLEYNSGVITTLGSTTLVPIYQYGGVTSVTAGQSTYRIDLGQMFAGNGTVATAINRLFLGECVASAGAITSVITYAYNGLFMSQSVTPLPTLGTLTLVTVNMGVSVKDTQVEFINITTEANYVTGDIIMGSTDYAGADMQFNQIKNRNSVGLTTGSAASGQVGNKTNGIAVTLTPAYWAYRVRSRRAF